MFDCGGFCSTVPNVGPVPEAPALLFAQVIDEDGKPNNFDPEYAQVVDGQLDFAEVGKPSLPSSFDLPAPPTQNFRTNIPKRSSGGCANTDGGNHAPLFALFLGLFLAATLRGTRSQS